MSYNIFKRFFLTLIIISLISSIYLPEIDSTKNISKNTEYELLIIGPEEFKSYLIPLSTHKLNMGISSIFVDLEEIYNSETTSDGRDNAEKIKYYIKNAIEEWNTKYVLLVGGKISQTPFWHTPVRYVEIANDWESHFISDLYFADIYDSNGDFSSWDSDQDGL